jgi:transcriptional regulator with XRE-family HTH domain
MEIKDRIIMVLDAEQLTASKFADAIGVQRSSISHILSGRNNPSLEIIQKTLTTFGTLNSEWLLFGRGQMYKTSPERKLFDIDTPIIKEPEIEKAVENHINPITQNKKEEIQDELKITKSKSEIISEITNENTTPFSEPQLVKKNESKTEKIIIFNSDRTFTEYFPS